MNSQDQIRVSYVITTKNRGKYLEATLANIREFIEKCDELIIIDGMSSDGTAELVAKHRDIVTCFISESDRGEAHAFNKGVFRCRGKFIKPITDDDYFYPDAMRQLIAEMEGHPEIDAIQCGGEVWRIEDGRPLFVAYRFMPEGTLVTPQAIFDEVSIGLGIIFRRTTLEIIGGVSSNYVSVDGDLTCRFVECNCAIRYLDVNLYRWYIHPHSGFNKQRAFERDRLLFDIRLGQWDRVVQRSPGALADAASAHDARARALFMWLWIAGVLWRSVLWRVSTLVYQAGRALRRGARRLKPESSDESQGVGSETSPPRKWSGQLR